MVNYFLARYKNLINFPHENKRFSNRTIVLVIIIYISSANKTLIKIKNDPFDFQFQSKTQVTSAMDTRRGALAVPKVRRVGFFTPIEPPPDSQRPNRSQSGPVEPTTSSSPLSNSPSGNLISPVLIPPSRHHSDNLTSRAAAAAAPVPVPGPAAFRRHLAHDRSLHVGSYNPANSLLETSPPSSIGEISEDSVSLFGFQRSDSTKLSSSFPNGGFDLTLAVRAPQKSESKIANSSASQGKMKNAEVSGMYMYQLIINQSKVY